MTKVYKIRHIWEEKFVLDRMKLDEHGRTFNTREELDEYLEQFNATHFGVRRRHLEEVAEFYQLECEIVEFELLENPTTEKMKMGCCDECGKTPPFHKMDCTSKDNPRYK